MINEVLFKRGSTVGLIFNILSVDVIWCRSSEPLDPGFLLYGTEDE